MDRATGGGSPKTHPEVWERDGEPKASGGHSTIQREAPGNPRPSLIFAKFPWGDRHRAWSSAHH